MKLKPQLNIVIIGAGRVACHLSKALYKSGYTIFQVYSRTIKSAKSLALQVGASYTNSINKIKPDAHIYILSISDHAVENILDNIKIKNGLIVHTSGSLSIDIFKSKVKNYGVLYPLQSFIKEREIDLKSVPILIEANTKKNETVLKNIATSISERVEVVSSSEREKIHIASVFACNFTNHMYAIAYNILKKYNIPFSILHPLIIETATRTLDIDSPKIMQTGPAIRKDKIILEKHIKLLTELGAYNDIYALLSKSIVDINK